MSRPMAPRGAEQFEFEFMYRLVDTLGLEKTTKASALSYVGVDVRT